MNKQIFKLFLLLLSIMLILSMMSGCSKERPDDSDTTTSDPVPVREEAHISSADLGDYVIVTPKDAGASVINAAVRFRVALEENYGCRMIVSDDEYRFFAKDKTVKPREILIDRTNRDETTEFLKSISYGDAGTALIGKKLVICGSSEEQTVQILDSMIEQIQAGDVFYSNQSDKIEHSSETTAKKSFEIAGVPLSEYKIVYSGTVAHHAVERLYHTIGKQTGVCLPIVRTGVLDADNPIPAFLFGCAENVKKGLSETYGFAEYGYQVKLLGDAPQVILDGETLYSISLGGNDFLSHLFAGETIDVNTAVKKCSINEIDEPAAQKAHPVDGMKLAGGDLSQYRIVYAEESSGKTAYAAKELAKYLLLATGVEIPVVLDTEEAGNDLEIVVGETNRDTDGVKSRRAGLVNDGIIYYMEGNRLFLTSHTDAGQMYAVYRFLEAYVGCRFYAADFETIRPLGVVEIPSDLDYSYSTPLFYRYIYWMGYNEANFRKLGINSGEDIMYSIVGFCHTLGALSETGDGTSANPCLCDEEIYQTVLKNVRARIEANPGCRVISVTQNDTYTRCQCEKCLAMEEAEHPSGLMLTFVNRLADDIREDYPDVKILTFAYQYTRTPPVTVKARDNVMIWLCSIECCFHHTLDDASCVMNRPFAQDIEAWAEYCQEMYIWDYTANYSRYTFTFPDFNVLRQNMMFFLDKKASGVFEEGDPQLENGEFCRLRRWLLCQLLWNPYMSEDEYDRLMDEFLQDYYGAGWRAIRYFIEVTCETLKDDMGIFDASIDANSFSVDPEVLTECFARAIAAAEDEETRRHCEVSSLQVECLRAPSDEKAWEELKRKLYDAGVRYLDLSGPFSRPDDE